MSGPSSQPQSRVDPYNPAPVWRELIEPPNTDTKSKKDGDTNKERERTNKDPFADPFWCVCNSARDSLKTILLCRTPAFSSVRRALFLVLGARRPPAVQRSGGSVRPLAHLPISHVYPLTPRSFERACSCETSPIARWRPSPGTYAYCFQCLEPAAVSSSHLAVN